MPNGVDIYVKFPNFVMNKKFELFKNTMETNRTLLRTIWSSHCYFAKRSLVKRLVLTVINGLPFVLSQSVPRSCLTNAPKYISQL